MKDSLLQVEMLFGEMIHESEQINPLTMGIGSCCCSSSCSAAVHVEEPAK